MFEVYLDTLDKDLQHLQEMTAYIKVQNQPLLLKNDLGDTLTQYGSEPQKEKMSATLVFQPTYQRGLLRWRTGYY